jgi:TnpA family transposase
MKDAKGFNYKEAEENTKKFVRYREGSKMYSMGISKFQEIAKKAGAIYKINQMVLVNTEILDHYIEKFKVIGVNEND